MMGWFQIYGFRVWGAINFPPDFIMTLIRINDLICISVAIWIYIYDNRSVKVTEMNDFALRQNG